MRPQDVGVGQRIAGRQVGKGFADLHQEGPVFQLPDLSKILEPGDVPKIAALLEITEDVEGHACEPSRSAR